ncbi:cupin domain-containing protein [Streptomyces sp. NPDC050145]|uniref:cupin domain-containing protein n=1 Tax=Streptomyces sp. NPDC050145 TaxID=3365602 RepID=UPI00379EFAC0
MTDTALQPVALRRDHQQGSNLPPLPLWPAEMLPRPMKSHRNVAWFVGDELTCAVYDSDDGTVSFSDLPYDEHVYVLHGRALLTSVDGQQHVYRAGDAFAVPRGWTGTWTMTSGYRELICIATPSLLTASKKWWPQHV